VTTTRAPLMAFIAPMTPAFYSHVKILIAPERTKPARHLRAKVKKFTSTRLASRFLVIVALSGLSSCGASTSIFAREVSLYLTSSEEDPGTETNEEVHIRGVGSYFAHQDDPQSCWAASLTTLLNYLNYPTSQSAILEAYNTSRHEECTTEQGIIHLACNDGSLSATRDQIVDAGVGAIHSWVSVDASDTAIKPPFDAIRVLSSGLPFLLLLSFGTKGHVYTVVGARYRRRDRALDTLFVLDPNFNRNTEIPLSARWLNMGSRVVYVLEPSRRAHAEVVILRVSKSL